MASLNQDIIIHELDRFTIRFNVLDNEGVINPDEGELAWWGVAAGSTVPSSPAASNVKIQKSDGAWTISSATSAVQVQDYGGLTIGDSYIQVEVPLNSGSTGNLQSGSINIALVGEDDQIYYHECVYTNDGTADNSIVIATGNLTVKPSLFTNAGYRA